MLKYIQPYKLFETKNYKIMDYSFIFNPNSNTGFFNITLYNKEMLELMFKKDNNKKEETSSFKLFPPTINILDFEDLTHSLIDILNSNTMGYSFSLKNITNRRYGLSSYANIESNKSIQPNEMEILVDSIKPKKQT